MEQFIYRRGRHLIYVLVTICLLLVVGGVLAFFFMRLQREQAAVSRTNEILKTVEIVAGSVERYERDLYAALLLGEGVTHVPASPPPVLEPLGKIRPLVVEVNQAKRFGPLVNLIDGKRSKLIAVAQMAQDGRTSDAISVLRDPQTQNLFHQLHHEFIEFEEAERLLLANRVQQAFTSTGQVNLLVWAALLTALVTVVIAYVQLNRELRMRSDAELELRKSEEKFRTISECSPVGMFSTDPEGRCEYVNPMWEQMTGIRQADAAGEAWARAIHPNDSADYLGRWKNSVMEGKHFHAETRMVHSSGEVVWLMTHAAPIRTDGEVTGYIGIAENITEQRMAQDAINAALREKTVLLNEIHHRVKNNLQIVSSLLQLQMANVSAGPIRDILNDSRNRILTMALIHETLYQSPSLARVNLKQYAQKLSNQLVQSAGAGAKLEISGNDVQVGADNAVTCGLILNELISNALKYGAVNGQPLMIGLGLYLLPEGHIRVEVHDNGPGLPIGFDIERTNTLGLKLVRSLVRQLNGTLESDNCAGARFAFVFYETPIYGEGAPA